LPTRTLARVIWCVVLLLFIGVLGGVLLLFSIWQGKILPGVRVDGVKVGGLTEEEAERKVSLLGQEFLAAPVQLVAGDNNFETTRNNLGFSLNVAKNVRCAYLVGRSGSLWGRAGQIWNGFHSQVVIPLDVNIDRQKAQTELTDLAADLVYAPQDAKLVINDRDEVIIVPSKPGRKIEVDTILDDLRDFKKPFAKQLDLKFQEQQPRIQTADIMAMGINGLLSSYETYFDAKNTDRTYNVHVAADALDNTMLKPGEIFSFNKVVGPRSKEKGYREALVIVQDQFTPGLGGGVCQVSSTLYNTALLAGLEIIERINHSLPVGYVPLGRDATVAYGGYDLKFRNNTNDYICIRTSVRDGRLVIKIFGNKDNKPVVSVESVVDKVLEPKVIKKDDPDIYEGKTIVERPGVKGYQVRVYRTIKRNSSYDKKLISRDTYKPVDELIRVGTRPVPETLPSPPVEELLEELQP
jgi:vancomycin resistance protein YoaR